MDTHKYLHVNTEETYINTVKFFKSKERFCFVREAFRHFLRVHKSVSKNKIMYVYVHENIRKM